MKIKFVCTGSCGEDHPIHDHCKECHHSEFKAVVPYKRGKVTIYFNMLHGPLFYNNGEQFYPPNRSKLWKDVDMIWKFGGRNCDYWLKRTNKKKETHG